MIPNRQSKASSNTRGSPTIGSSSETVATDGASSATTPLHDACINGDDDAITQLLSHGADPNLRDASLKTPLFVAIENGQFNAVRLLDETNQVDFDALDLNGQSALHHAAVGQGNAALYIKFLVKRTSVFKKNRNGLTAREYAQRVDRFKHHRVIKLLRDLEAEETKLTTFKEGQLSQEKKSESGEGLQANLVLVGLMLGVFLFLVDLCLRKFRRAANAQASEQLFGQDL